MSQTETAAAEPVTAKSLQLPCPCCGEPQANINLQLWCGDFQCTECDAEFAASDLRERIAAWSKLLAWIDGMPTSE